MILDYHMPGIEIPQETFHLVDAVVLKGDAVGQLLPTVTQLLQQGLNVPK